MSGRVPPSNRVSRRIAEKLAAAAELYADFSGHDAETLDEIDLDVPEAGLIIGELDGLLYTTVRDGEEESYIHEFRAKSKPVLVASDDGSMLLIIGGNYKFTERGIVDR